MKPLISKLTLLSLFSIGLMGLTPEFLVAEEPIPAIPRRIPPQGIATEKELAQLQSEVEKIQAQVKHVASHALFADVSVYLKAVQLAVNNNEFYKKSDLELAKQLLQTAATRAAELKKSRSASWEKRHGLIVRGYRSSIDGSAQPYGLEIPENLDLSRPVSLYVWLHGRGDKTTDLHFIAQRESRAGKINVQDAIIVHPFGRQCIGFKSTGEIDVMEVIDHVSQNYPIDSKRIVLMGFSMGGAGAWHVGAHYTDQFVAMSPGAGFAETARYTRLAKADYPTLYEQKLWGQYDVPNYVRNLFNLPVIAYSGENDKQIQAAQVMEEAFIKHGKKLTHLIGPGMGHKYHPETLADILQRIKVRRDQGLNPSPASLSLQTQTLRYNQMHWVAILGLQQHWQDARVDAKRISPTNYKLETKNISALQIDVSDSKSLAVNKPVMVNIDQQTMELPANLIKSNAITLSKQNETWQAIDPSSLNASLTKKPGLQGPIDDVFLAPFLVVVPRSQSGNKKVQRWLDFEIAHFQDRWQALYRGKLRMKYDDEVTPDDIKNYHLIAWGTPATNQIIKRTISDLPLKWNEDALELGPQKFSATNHVPLLIYPNPLNPEKYLVLNSGPTFREDHDRTNSLQNPKLPDWAIIDLSVDPNGSTPGKVVLADFFDESWNLKNMD